MGLIYNPKKSKVDFPDREIYFSNISKAIGKIHIPDREINLALFLDYFFYNSVDAD